MGHVKDVGMSSIMVGFPTVHIHLRSSEKNPNFSVAVMSPNFKYPNGAQTWISTFHSGSYGKFPEKTTLSYIYPIDIPEISHNNQYPQKNY